MLVKKLISYFTIEFTVVYCGILWYTVVYCNILWYTVIYCGTLWYTVVMQCSLTSVNWTEMLFGPLKSPAFKSATATEPSDSGR